MSRRAASKYPRRTKVTIPAHVGPHVKLVFAAMQSSNRVYDDVEEGSGVKRATIKAWRTKNKPSLESMEAVLGYLGYDFLPIPREAVLPPAVVLRLRPIAEHLNMKMPEVVAALVEIASGLSERKTGERASQVTGERLAA